jgi:hypothetical protein
MFAISIIVWTIFIGAVVSRYPQFFNRIRFDSSDDSDSDSEPDENMVGHSSLSDTEDSLDSDSEFDPDEDEAAHILLNMSLEKYDKIPEYMKDFYEEAKFSADWMKLSESEKLAKLDEELNRIFVEQKSKNSKTC